jgi:hypothetical protein
MNVIGLHRRWLGWLFNRRVARGLLWALVLLAVAVTANVVGIALIGSVDGWRDWMARASGFFLLWRLCLYSATVYGWLWMRRRLLSREPDAQAKHRLIRAEIAGAVAILALEASLLFQPA